MRARSATFAAAPLPVAPTVPTTTDALFHAARIILPYLERGQRVDAPTLRAAMESVFGGSDADGAWDWKTVKSRPSSTPVRRCASHCCPSEFVSWVGSPL